MEPRLGCRIVCRHGDYHWLSLHRGSPAPLEPKTMRLQQLQLIVALAEAGSLRAAASRMNVTQPALSKALSQLEDEFAPRWCTARRRACG
jgi:Bacterial regulatory helix-turn-helix protein, lysR family